MEDVKAKGYVQCGVTGGVPGFSAPDANNVWSGLEVDYCRAMAAAIFDDPDKVRYTRSPRPSVSLLCPRAKSMS